MLATTLLLLQIATAQVCFTPPTNATLYVSVDNTRWYTTPDKPGEWYCYCGANAGVYYPDTGKWRAYDRATMTYRAPADTCPIVPPVQAKPADKPRPLPSPLPDTVSVGQDLPTGVVPGKIEPNKYSVNGREVDANVAYNAIESRVEDQSSKRRITVIGNTSERKAALSQLPPDVGKWAVVKGYDKDHWYIQTNGFANTGSPTVYVQEPDGKVLHRQDNADGLAKVVAKLDPHYDPSTDPDARKGLGGVDLLAVFDSPVVKWGLVLLAGFLAVRFGPGLLAKLQHEPASPTAPACPASCACGKPTAPTTRIVPPTGGSGTVTVRKK